MDLILTIINSIILFIILITFFKMSANTTAIKEILTVSNNKRNARTNYYKYLALNDNEAAYKQILYIIFLDLTEQPLSEKSRKLRYDSLKNKYSDTLTKIGYEFPDFPF